MGPEVSGEMVGAAERSQADLALERLLSRMDPNVTGEFVRTRKTPVAAFNGAGVRPFMNGGFRRSSRIFSGFHLQCSSPLVSFRLRTMSTV